MNMITTGLTCVCGQSLGTRFTQTVTSLKVNGILVDVSFKVPQSYTGKWDFLKNLYLNVTLRLGASTEGGAVALISDVSLFSLLNLSDYLAGVSLSSTTFTAGETVRMSGYLTNGFFAMGDRDALEFSLTCADASSLPSENVNVTVSACYDHVEQTNFIVYKESVPTGADQPYNNVLNLYYIGSSVNKNISVVDHLGNKTVNIADAIAYSNARGRFEFFTDFGQFYSDEFGVSQNVSMRVPVVAGSKVLCQQYAFYPLMLAKNDDELTAERDALISKIQQNDSDKYKYLSMLGIA